ncbi:hypothetical protein TURU_144204 [Turdus rufiventris]|nr:hypothetical protein TURU_144204 [Turdus rufiventris]
MKVNLLLQLVVEGTLRKTADDTKVCGAIDTLERRVAIQKDLDKLQRWPFEDLMKSNKAKGKVLHLGLGNPKGRYRLGKEWTETSPGEKDLDVLVDENFNITQQ